MFDNCLFTLSVSSAATSRNRSMFGRLSDSETDSDLMLDDEEDSNLIASDGELSTSRAEKLGSIHSDSVDSDNWSMDNLKKE